MKISRRWLLVAIISLTQLASLLIGVFWYTRWLEGQLTTMLRNQVHVDNSLAARQFGTLIESMDLSTLEAGSSDWKTVQDLVEHLNLPNDGFLCIADGKTGLLLCHPEFRNDPGIAKTNYGDTQLISGLNSQTVNEESAANRENQPITGSANMADGVHLIGVYKIPHLNANVLAHQKDSEVQRNIARTVRPAAKIIIPIFLFAVLMSTAGNILILRRYDNKLFSMNEHLESKVEKRTRSLIKTRNAVTFGLAKLAESRDNDTGEHLDRISKYVTILAEELESKIPSIDHEFIAMLGIASSLHDVGKVGIPDLILLKPGRLTDEERRVMELHAGIGADCLSAIQRKLGDDDFLEMAQNIARSHHERWDGTGYPDRLHATKIPQEARIVSVADVYDALRSNRPYKKGFTHEKSRNIIVEGRGTQFDPMIVDAFLARENEFMAISKPFEQVTETPSLIAQLAPIIESPQTTS